MIKYSYRNTTLLYPLIFYFYFQPPSQPFWQWKYSYELDIWTGIMIAESDHIKLPYLNMTYRYSINLFRWMKILIITIILIIYLLMHKIISLGIYHCLYLHGTVLSERGTNASCHTICLKDQFQPCRVLTFRKEMPHFITWSLYWFSQGACWLKRLSNR